jgi:hypothetical protein
MHVHTYAYMLQSLFMIICMHMFIFIGQNEDNYAVASELVILDKTKKELKIYVTKKIERDTQLEVQISLYVYVCS